MSDTLDMLRDKDAIRELVHRLFIHTDRREWPVVEKHLAGNPRLGA